MPKAAEDGEREGKKNKCRILVNSERLRCEREEKAVILTSVKSRGVVHVCSYERRFSLSANSVIPHPPDTTLEQDYPT